MIIQHSSKINRRDIKFISVATFGDFPETMTIKTRELRGQESVRALEIL